MRQRSRDRAVELARGGDPEEYLREIFGWRLSDHQRKTVYAFLENQRLVLVGSNGTGKSVIGAGLTLGWTWDAKGSLDDGKGMPVGCALLILAPTAAGVLEAYQSHFLELGRLAAESKKGLSDGHLIAGWGDHSEDSVRWAPIKGRWYMRGITTRREAGTDEVSHAVLGPHHRNMIAWLEELKAIYPKLYEALRGRLVSKGNRAIASTNPTDTSGLAYRLSTSQGTSWKTIYSSSIGARFREPATGELMEIPAHENVIYRREVIPGAVSHEAVEEDLRNGQNFEHRGLHYEGDGDPPAGFAVPNLKRGDFLYALPEADLPDKEGPRRDGIIGHPDAKVVVLRPRRGISYGRVIGTWPGTDPLSLFSRLAVQRAQSRWTSTSPDGPPDGVGIDASLTDLGDEALGSPWWGPTARQVLRLAWAARPFKEVQRAGRPAVEQYGSLADGAEALRTLDADELRKRVLSPDAWRSQSSGGLKALERWLEVGRMVYVGDALGLPASDEERAKELLISSYGRSPVYNVDPAFGRHFRAALRTARCRARDMSFGGAAAGPLDGQTRAAFNARAEWYFSVADLVDLDLIALPPSTLLMEDLVAIGPPIPKRKASKAAGRGGKVDVFKLRPKSEIMEFLDGRSPDRGDTLALAGASPISGAWEVG